MYVHIYIYIQRSVGLNTKSLVEQYKLKTNYMS